MDTLLVNNTLSSNKDFTLLNTQLLPEQKYLLIHELIEKYNIKNQISYLCELLEVSRSGYYAYFSHDRIHKRNPKELEDEFLKENILKAYFFKNRKKGAKQIKLGKESFIHSDQESHYTSPTFQKK